MGVDVVKRAAAAAVAAALLGPPATAAAGTIVDTGTPPIGAWVTSAGYIFASQFSVAKPFTIDAVHAHLGNDAATSFKLVLFGNSPGFPSSIPSGRLFESGIVNLAAGEERWVGTAVDWDIEPGVYWIGLHHLDGALRQTTRAPQPLGNEVYVLGGSLIFAANALDLGWRISGQPQAVPEPGAWALMILGFGAAGGALRRRRFAARLSANEPRALA